MLYSGLLTSLCASFAQQARKLMGANAAALKRVAAVLGAKVRMCCSQLSAAFSGECLQLV